MVRNKLGNAIRVCEFCGLEPGSPLITPNDEIVSCLRCAALCVELVTLTCTTMSQLLQRQLTLEAPGDVGQADGGA